MIKFIINILFTITLLISLSIGCIYFVLNSEQITQKILMRTINAIEDNISLSNINISNQKFNFPFTLVVDGLNFDATIDKEKFSIKFGKININVDLFDFFKNKNRDINTSINIKGLNFSSKMANINNLVLDLNGYISPSDILIEGDCFAESAESNGYEIKSIKSNISSSNKKLILNDIIADLYEGKIKGQIILDYNNSLPYTIVLKVDKVDLALLEKVNPAVSSNIKCKILGDINIRGDKNDVSFLQASFNALDGGQLNSSLLGPLLEFIPKSEQRKNLDYLIKNNKDVFFEKGDIKFSSLSPEKLNTDILLESEKLNLDINLSVEINIDGGLKSLLGNIDLLSQK